MMRIFIFEKKNVARLLSILLALLLMSAALSGCALFSASDVPIEELLPAIKAEYLKGYGEYGEDVDVGSVRYYGRYNGVDVVMVCANWEFHFPATHDVMIAGYAFNMDYQSHIDAWKDGKLIDLQAAYDQQLLTRVQIAEIADIHKNKTYTIFK